MTTVEKTFFDGDTHKVEFIYNGLIGSISFASEIINVGSLDYGDYDADEHAFFPSSLKITLNNFITNDYFGCKNFIAAYNRSYPFNFKDVFYTKYYINGVLEHTGVLFDVSYSDSNENIEMTMTDASDYFKITSLESAEFLAKMSENGLLKNVQGTGLGNVIFYGLQNAFLQLNHSNSKWDIRTNLVTDQSFLLTGFLNLIFSAVNPDVNFNTDIDLLYADNDDFDGAVGIEQLRIFGVHTNYIGRYLVIPKLVMEVINMNDDYELVNESDEWKVFRYKESQALDDKNLISIVKKICQNFFGRMGFKSFDKITLSKKYLINPDDCPLITDDDIVNPEYSKISFIPNVKYLRVDDAFSGRYATHGFYNTTLPDDAKLQYSIQFSAYQEGSLSGYSLYYNDGTANKPALFCKDPVSGFSDTIPYLLAQLEWYYRREYRDKYSLTLWGIDWDFSKCYKFEDKSANKVLRPMKMSRNSERNETTVEFIDITHN